MKFRSLSLTLLSLSLAVLAAESIGEQSVVTAQGGSTQTQHVQAQPVQGQAVQAPGQTAPAFPPAKPVPARVFVWTQTPKLKLGDAAPALRTAQWVKGRPITFGNGKVTVVSFWSTWCIPSRETFEPLREMATQYRGKADFVGVDVMEQPEDIEAGIYKKKVESFVQDRERQMPYAIAMDDPSGTISKQWLDMSAQTIPVAYIVDGSGRIAWIGHPLADLNEVLPKVINGTYDLNKAAKQQEIHLVVEGQLRSTFTPIQQAMSAENYKKAVEAINVAIEKTPKIEVGLGPTKFQMLLHSDEPAAYTYAKTLADGVCKDSPSALNLVAWCIVEDGAGLKNPNYAVATDLARRACDLTQFTDPYIMDTLALCYYRTGEKTKALDLQVKAVTLAENKKDVNLKLLNDLRDRLALYRKMEHP